MCFIDLVPGAYDRWSQMFDNDSSWRASTGFVDEEKTIKAKVSETAPIVVIFNVDVKGLIDTLMSPEFASKVEGLFASPPEVFLGFYAPLH